LCRLFGLIANKPVDVRYSFYLSPHKFEDLSKDNPHGWGIAWLTDKGWGLFKEPIPLHKSSRARNLIEKQVRGRIIISHVRKASDGSPSFGNTHPWQYRGWVFAHNGKIGNRRDRDVLLGLLEDEHRENLEGETDSELFFHLIVQEVFRAGDPVRGIQSAVRKILDKDIYFSSLNFVASDGKRLYALRCFTRKPYRYTLYYIERPITDDFWGLSDATKQLIETKLRTGERAIVVASEKISDEKCWREIPNGRLLVIDSDLKPQLREIKRKCASE